MDRKDIIIIILVLIIISLLALGLHNHQVTDQGTDLYRTVKVSPSFSLDVPLSSNLTRENVSENMYIVNDYQNDIQIISFNMKNASKMDLIEDGYQYLKREESYKFGAEEIIKISNHTVWHNKDDGSYIAFFSPNNTEDNIMLVTHDNITMARILSSARY
ncbi:hypothetical protein mru_0802 [Methanobrevibacter ruminantium M1]|uniref:Uncharacterized protein n=1 Tax=Methanobrevibacter ruminantium (strain ATCC 35063 / DSM 1093 / JCM 13430 / OCM 146 / M1) TaxID=634498 RepID=D3E292_METRM|nr:hypothetical protein [Methanobrevibacter ruminantium]ADC46653.1 hypothetical protein mru_0802 [Methanobrevibacter ruminantium M1]